MYFRQLVNHYLYNIFKNKIISEVKSQAKDQYDFINRMYEKNPSYGKYIHPKFLENPESILTVAKHDDTSLTIYKLLPDKLKYNKDFLKSLLLTVSTTNSKTVYQYSFLFNEQSNPIINNDFVKEIIEAKNKDSLSLFPLLYQSPFLKDKEIIHHMLNNDYYSTCAYMDKSLLNDKEYIIELLQNYPSFMPLPAHIDSSILHDKDFIIECLKKGILLKSFTDEDLNNPQVIDHILNSKSILLVSELSQTTILNIAKDPEKLKTLLIKDARALLSLDESVRNDISIVKHAFKSAFYNLSLLGEELRNNYDIIKLSIEKNGANIKYVPLDKCTPELYKLAIESNGLSIKYFPDKYKNRYLTLAMCQDWEAIAYAPEEKLKNTEWILEQFELLPSDMFTNSWIDTMIKLNSVVEIEDSYDPHSDSSVYSHQLINKLFQSLMLNNDVKNILEEKFFKDVSNIPEFVLQNHTILDDLFKYLEEHKLNTLMQDGVKEPIQKNQTNKPVKF
jgi:hypothetical protein